MFIFIEIRYMKKLLLMILTGCPLLLLAQRTILHCGKLIDVTKGQLLNEYSIIVEGNTITDVQPGYTKPSGTDKVIDLKSKTVLPGLIDCHVHMEHETSPTRYLETFTSNPADYAFQSVVFAE